MSRKKPIATSSIATLHLVGINQKIKEFLHTNLDEEFNAIALSEKLQIPYNSLRATLFRMYKLDQIKQTHRGFYSAKIILDKHQIQKIDNKIDLHYHNIQFWIPKIGHLDCNIDPPPPPIATSQNFPHCNIIATNCNIIATSTEIIEVNPNQRISINEYPDHFDVIVAAGENPLDHREARWLTVIMNMKFSKAQLKETEWVKYDINHDGIRIERTRNQITYSDSYSDFEGSVIAIYQKGEVTRFEGRNLHDRKTFKDFLSELLARENVKELQEKQFIPAPKIEKYVPPLSEFRTGLQILVDRGGVEALEDLRRKYHEQEQPQSVGI